MTDYLADVRRYDALADAAVVERIVKHLGIALRSRESSLVSCKDQKELDRVAEKWCGKKLGVADERRVAVALVNVCMSMERDYFKSRVTFYYLAAKHLERLDVLGAAAAADHEESPESASE